VTRGCWALIAVNARVDCKSRLAGKLAVDMRLSLVRVMLERALTALRGSRTITNIAVVTPERDTIPADVQVIPDPGGGLNAALDAARHILVGDGASELLVLHADLPLVTAAEIDQLVESGRRTGFAIATDAAGTGTNALYIAPPTSFRFRFGPGSRFRHLEEAARLGMDAKLLRLHGLEFDVDGPVDLDRLLVLRDARYDFLSLLGADQTGAAHEPIQSAGEVRTRR
jgi:2-phospho-L-lactate guanylyltransferase